MTDVTESPKTTIAALACSPEEAAAWGTDFLQLSLNETCLLSCCGLLNPDQQRLLVRLALQVVGDAIRARRQHR